MRANAASCAGEVVLFELLAWLQEQEQYCRAEDAPDTGCVLELLCEDSDVPAAEATAAQASGYDEASSAASCALHNSAHSILCMIRSCCIACGTSRVIHINRLFLCADVEYHHERLSLYREEIRIPGER